MSCCGQKREAFNIKVDASKAQKSDQVNADQPSHRPYQVFRYKGQLPSTFLGAVTHKSYCFKFNGDTRMVDYRDSPALVAEPLLQQVIFC